MILLGILPLLAALQDVGGHTGLENMGAVAKLVVPVEELAAMAEALLMIPVRLLELLARVRLARCRRALMRHFDKRQAKRET